MPESPAAAAAGPVDTAAEDFCGGSSVSSSDSLCLSNDSNESNEKTASTIKKKARRSPRKAASSPSVMTAAASASASASTPRRPQHPQKQNSFQLKIQRPPPSSFGWFYLLRSLLLDLPLMLLFASFVGICFVRRVHNQFYQPLIERATRTDEQLMEEFTYYERQCTEYDLSTHNIQDMLVDVTSSTDKERVVQAAVDQMMTHGATVIPELMKPDTVKALREFIVRKNAAITAAEAYPMSQGEQRLSYGIDASEDPAVAAAIQEVANHPVLRPLVAALLGDDDPASAEITSITAYAGAADQVWHQDTKQDGNAIKFARTYSHSYSLFMPLQDTTELMGATDICPGTHYCTNDLAAMCEDTKMGLHLVGGGSGGTDSFFPAGHGALVNQHLWHRGGAHTDRTAPERIVFILSFLARPQFGTDPRQLSRGTYFHQKWLMWGHTWKDLLDPAARMRRPFSILRCLSLWKPFDGNWGYDLITSGFMRFTNEQLEYDDFEYRFLPRLDQFGFPAFLRGRHLRDELQKTTWTVFILETIDNVYSFVAKANLYAHGAYLGLVLLTAILLAARQRYYGGSGSIGARVLGRAVLRLTLTHVLLAASGFLLWHRVSHSDWGQSISSGTALMRPFPPLDRDVSITEASTMYGGLSTLPTRNDVLVGSRFDVDFLGSYNKWLDYHPGNAVFRQAVAESVPAYAAYNKLGPSLRWSIVQTVIEEVEARGGRFLGQDYLSGDWIIMNPTEKIEAVSDALAFASSRVVSAVRKLMDWNIANHRFGPRRESAMARASQLLLWHIKRSMMIGFSPLSVPQATTVLKAGTSSAVVASPLGTVRFVPSSSKTIAPAPSIPSRRFQQIGRCRFSGFPSSTVSRNRDDNFQEGSLVWVSFEDDVYSWYPGTVTHTDNGEGFRVAFEDGSWEAGIDRSRLQKFTPVTENDRVEGCFAKHELEDCYPGTIVQVMPGGYVSIAYDDGEFSAVVSPMNYYVPPFRYGGPFIL